MTQNSAKLIFWGVRGSTPTLERDTWRYGGNTPCLELTVPGGPHFILDCGTGLRMLGNHLHAMHNRWTRWQATAALKPTSGHPLPLGPHSGHSVLPSVFRIAEPLSFLQLSIEASGPQQPATGARSAVREPLFPGGRQHDVVGAFLPRSRGRRKMGRGRNARLRPRG